jgi:hypothetical protein
MFLLLVTNMGIYSELYSKHCGCWQATVSSRSSLIPLPALWTDSSLPVVSSAALCCTAVTCAGYVPAAGD